MDLLERYLQSVGEYLPAKGKRDTLAELRANLLAQIEGREEELGRPLTEGEVAAILEAHGRPIVVASRYMSHQYLIGPGLFPVYWFTLRKSLPFVFLAFGAAQFIRFLLEGGRGDSLGAAIGSLPGTLFIFWGVMTLAFACFERIGGRSARELRIPDKWDPTKLAPLTSQEKQPSMAHRVADLIVNVMIVLWLLALPFKPILLIGPGAAALHGIPFGFTREWHIFYWQIMGLLIATLPLKAALLFRSGMRWRRIINIAVQALGVLVLVILVQVRTYMVPAASLAGTTNWKTVEAVLLAINLGFKFALAVSVLKLLWDIWKMITDGPVPNHYRSA